MLNLSRGRSQLNSRAWLGSADTWVSTSLVYGGSHGTHDAQQLTMVTHRKSAPGQDNRLRRHGQG